MNDLPRSALEQIPYSISIQKKRSITSFSEFSGMMPQDELTAQEKEDLLDFQTRVYSISQLETYGACPFKFFVHFGLRAEEVALKPGRTWGGRRR